MSEKKTDQELAREDKFKKLGEKGIKLFPHKAEFTHNVFDIVSQFADISPEDLEKDKMNVVVPGRIVSVRKMGRACFFHISDSRSKLQAYLREDNVGKDGYELFSLYDIGDVLSIKGSLNKTGVCYISRGS